jgi:hypothetical protein
MVASPNGLCAGKASSNVNDRPILSSERMLHKATIASVQLSKKLLVVSLKGLVAKTN